MTDETKNRTLYASPEGNDKNSGTRDEPIKSFEEIQRRIISCRSDDPEGLGHIKVILREGRYELSTPWKIGPGEGGIPSAEKPTKGREFNTFVSYEALEGENPVISGGRAISGLRETEHRGARLWTANLKDSGHGGWAFREIWVNGHRRHRPRLPREDFYHVEGLSREIENPSWNTGDDEFLYGENQFNENWHNLNDVEVCLFNYWVDSRINVKSVDAPSKRVTLAEKSETYLMSARGETKGAPYWIENVFEELTRPGEWYLDKEADQFYYLPLPGEVLEESEIIAPVLDKLLIIEGEDLELNPVVCLKFKGLTFSHTHIDYKIEKKEKSQAAADVPGALTLSHARKIFFEDCSLIQLGGYAMNLAEKTRDIAIRGSIISDLGAGGLRIWHGCNRTEVSDCTISNGGHIFHRAVGILIGQSSGNRIIHNHIHEFDYSGISAGWCWGYAESAAYGNIIEHNHIHHIGHGRLSDMGGIYLLGDSTGSRVRYNLIHHVESRHYGGWGIYTDEGSSHVLIEYNVVHSCQGSFDQHYGRENMVRNNIFCLGSETQMRRLRPEEHSSFTFKNNIVYFREGTVWAGGQPEKGALIDKNIYFDPERRNLDFGELGFSAWQDAGQDRNSLIADPRLKNPEEEEFGLSADSPAWEMGFMPFSVDDAGPRQKHERGALPRGLSADLRKQEDHPIG